MDFMQTGHYYWYVDGKSEAVPFIYIEKGLVYNVYTGRLWVTLTREEFRKFCEGGIMPIKAKRIKELRVFAVEYPKKDGDSLTGGMVRVQTCRSCKSYCGEHGGDYVECSYEG